MKIRNLYTDKKSSQTLYTFEIVCKFKYPCLHTSQRVWEDVYSLKCSWSSVSWLLHQSVPKLKNTPSCFKTFPHHTSFPNPWLVWASHFGLNFKILPWGPKSSVRICLLICDCVMLVMLKNIWFSYNFS